MKICKLTATKNLFLIALCAMFMSCLLLGYSFFSGTANAAVGSGTTAISALYDFNKYCYDQNSLNTLAENLLGNGKTFNELIEYAKGTGPRGTSINNRELTVEYGRYRSSTQAAYKPLVWIPVYLSKSTSGDAVLTLYLAESAATNGTTSSQEVYQFSYSGGYVSATGCNAPTNSYGTSHMRAVTLGNLGQYATYKSDHSGLDKLAEASEPKSSKVFKFSDFITTSDGVAGHLTDDIVTPSEMEWQANESAMTLINSNGTYYESGSSSNPQPISTYSWPNEAYSTPSSINYYLPGYFDYSQNDTTDAKRKYNYSEWKNDKVWLPSLSEVGTGNLDGNNDGYLDGVWKLDNAQRGNNMKSWLRTACTKVNRGGTASSPYSIYTMFATATDGTITTADANERCGIRPAIHLNLSKISKKTIAPINLPDEITTTYNGEGQVISASGNTTVPQEQLEGWWRNDGSMIVSFYVYEKENQTEFNIPVAPLDAGTYYMVVELLNPNSYFLGEAPGVRWKATKFTIKKIQLDVVWEYDIANYNQPKSVKFVDESQILDRDIQAGLKPSIGMMYSYYNGSGLHDSKEFPDLKGEYYATAYILDDDLYDYNYEIADGTKTSAIFTVKEKNVESPYFLEAKDSGRNLSLIYRGAQYVQIANVSKYVDINLTKVTSSDTAAESKVEDLGVVNNVHTFIVESVGSYVFTASLSDKTNTQWVTSTEQNKDTKDLELELTIGRAEVTVSFEGLPSSWDTNTAVSFSLTVLGVHETTDVAFRVYYAGTSNASQRDVFKNSVTGKYEIPAGLNVDSYNIFALVQGQIGGNYYMKNNSNFVSQKFTVYQAAAAFGSSNANWQYVRGDGSSPVSAGAYNAHNTPQTALEVENTGENYKFSMVWSETRFTDKNLKATYTGDKSVKDAGLYSVTVVISAYNKNVSFTDETYTIYFRIKKKLLDLSELKWDYSGTPFTYSGTAQSVGITAESLALVPGLTVDKYTTNGNGTDASTYTTSVSFVVSDSNYEIPVATDQNSYRGAFSFTCEWVIDPQKIIVVWTTPDASSNVAFVPKLQVGTGYVEYSYEHRLSDGSWVDCTTLTAETVTETYRVSAKLKPAYANNYELVDNVKQEFTVESGKQPVVLSYTINDEACDNDAQYAYTGSAFIVKPVVSSDTVSISSYNVEYFTAAGGVKLTSLGTTPPVNAGTYAAVVTVTFDGGYLATGSGNEIYFEITKADMDISSLRWTYTHTHVVGSTTVVTALSAYFDVAQGKWVDENSGAEVNFSFEYDGTEHKLILDGEAEYAGKINISDMRGTSATAVGNYTANVYYSWADNNYNDPQFPTSLSWSITKADTRFDDVKWGYIDEAGNEYEFDLDNDAFTYTRVAEGKGSREYAFTVGLINLPDYLKSAVKYYTTPQTVANSVEVEGNAFSAIGTYHTRFTFSGFAGDTNHNAVTSFPSTISSFVLWEIEERKLTHPSYNDGWTRFDDKAHNLLDLCNISEDELFYFHIDITFKDTENNITKNYDGSSYFGNDPDGENFGGEFFGYHAGIYTIYFSQIMAIGGVETDIFFDRVDIEVDKQVLSVVWDNNGSIPVARVQGVYISDIIETVYNFILQDGSIGGPAKLDYIKTTDGMKFCAQPEVSSKYAKNLTFEMADGAVDKFKFTTYKFTPNNDSAQLEKPEFENNGRLEFTGNTVTFTIADWYLKYEKYLYISDGESYDSDKGEAYAIEMGDYRIVVSFKKDANAYWKGTEGNRDPFTLNFTVTKPTRMALEYPVFNKYSEDYTGSSIEFRITNWMVLNEYLDYEVFYAGLSLGRNIDLRFVTAGIYTLKFTFKTNVEVTGYWKTTNDARDYEMQLEIVDPNNRSTTILNPKTDKSSEEYTGSEIEFNVLNWNSYYSRYITLSCSSPNVKISGGTIKATNVGSYTIVAKINSGVDVTFANLSKEYSFTVTITPAEGVIVPLEPPTFITNELTHTGSVLEFKISDWESIYAKYLELVCDNPKVQVSGGTIRVTDVGNYVLTVKFLPDVHATWVGGGTQSISLPFTVKAGGGTAEMLQIPTLTFTEKEYTGREITFVIDNWDTLKQYVTILEGTKHLTQTAVNEYTVTLKIRDTSKAKWAGRDEDTFSLTFYIKKANITVSVGDDGKPLAVNGDGETVDIDNFFEPHYYDPETNELVTDPVAGKEYVVKYSVKNEEEFNKCIENYEEVRSTITNNTYIIKYEPPKKGPNLVLIITIAAVAFVVLLFLVLVIVIAIRKRNAYYYDDYDEDYDEYDDYDDYDDYYDDEY